MRAYTYKSEWADVNMAVFVFVFVFVCVCVCVCISTFNIMNGGIPVIGNDFETATVTLLLSASNTMKSGVAGTHS